MDVVKVNETQIVHVPVVKITLTPEEASKLEASLDGYISYLSTSVGHTIQMLGLIKFLKEIRKGLNNPTEIPF